MKSNLEKFIIKARRLHLDRFDYSQVNYTDSVTPVVIICPKHGEFQQRPAEHVRGKSCTLCAKKSAGLKNKQRAFKLFIVKSKELHGDKYDYSRVVYLGNKSKVAIVCKQHGEFLQSPSHHIHMKSGCAKCRTFGYQKELPGSVYILSDGVVTKLGITNRPVTTRLWEINTASSRDFKIHTSLSFQDGFIAEHAEEILLKALKTQYDPIKETFPGHTECFTGVDVEKLSTRLKQLTGDILHNLN